MLQGIPAALVDFISLSPCPRRQVSPTRTDFFLLLGIFQCLRPLLLLVFIEWAKLNEPLGAFTLPKPLASERAVPKGHEEVALHDWQGICEEGKVFADT